MPLPFDFDFTKPDYSRVIAHRIKMYERLSDPMILAALKVYYKDHIGQFITDWGCTFDPRNPDIGLPSNVPFILFGRQEEWIEWFLNKWKTRKPGISDKSRDMGLSWLAIATACSVCIFNEGVVIGFGSRKEEYVDKIGSPKALFWKARKFLDMLPKQFLPSYHGPHMRILFPETNSAITGESGDGIGRGDRTTIYVVDESAYIERPELIDASLSNTTNCRIDISSAKGMVNSFAQRRHSGKIDVFTYHWRDDPRKAEDNKVYETEGLPGKVSWYEKMCNELDPVTLAQEVDINYTASVEGVVIPPEWVRAAIDACEKLGIEPTGARMGALDVADQGKDLNAGVFRHGVQLVGLKSWSGKESDTFFTTQKMFMLADEYQTEEFVYDADGLGAAIRGDSRVINEQRVSQKVKYIDVKAFRGSGEVLNPDKEMVKGRKNKDFFMNRKAQSWWALRFRFQNTFRAIKGMEYDAEEIISIPSKIAEFQKLIMELSQPTYTVSTNGKILIDKAPDNTRSPNLADGVMMLYAPPKRANGLFSAKG